MKKEDYVWVAIKVFGIYLMIKAISFLPEFSGGIYLMTFVFDHTPDKQNPANVYDMAYITQQEKTIINILEFVIHLSFSLYFLMGGKFISKLTNKS